jgi:hypothetical protein
MSRHPDHRDVDDERLAKRFRSEQQLSSLPIPGPSLYRQLSGSEIRLIKILPGSWGDPISCELVYLLLDDRPKYVALSYAWGDPTETQPVTLNGQVYHITKSLFTGLRRLRYMIPVADEDPETFITDKLESFYLWADAICINQEDEGEKSTQVTRMSDIYSLAGRVYAWLGENEEEDPVVRMIMGLAHCVGLDSRLWGTYLSQCFDHSSDEFRGFARGLINLSSRSWFSRIWVIQEVGLAARPPIILAGGAWSYMESLSKLANIILKYRTKGLDSIPGWKNITQIIFLSSIRRDCQEERNSQQASDVDLSSLGARLDRTLGSTHGYFEATLPHDYIYGLLGLVGSGALPLLLTADYEKPYPQVYQEYARFIVQNTGNLSIILRTDSDIDGFPSWVPDFRSHNSVWREPEESLYPISFSNAGNAMTLLGLELGLCTHIYTPPFPGELDLDTHFSARIHHFDSFLQKVSETKHLSKDKVLGSWLESEKDLRVHGLSITDLKSSYYSIISGEEQVNENQQTMACIAESVDLPSIFIAKEGILASLLRRDRDARPGDVLVAVRGTSKPLLLRPTNENGEYEFLGDCHYKSFEYNEALFSDQILKQFVII